MSIKDKIENHIVVWTFVVLVSGFSSGIATYEGLLYITNQETIVRDTYVRKSDLVGQIHRSTVITELDHLMEIGENANNSTDPSAAGVFLTRTRSFLQGLDLPKDVSFQQSEMSWPLRDLQMIMTQNPWFGHQEIDLPEQVARTIGLLEGMKSAYSARAGEAE